MGVYIWKERLPSTYQEVEYIESSGTQRIDTGVRPDDLTYGFECKFNLTSLPEDWNIMNLGGNNTDYYRYGFGGNAGTRWQIGGLMYSGFYWEDVYNPAPATNVDYTTIYNYNGDRSWKLNGTTYVSSVNTGSYTYNVNWNIFCQAYGSGSYTRYSVAKLYYMKIWHGTTLIRDFVPCYRKSDNVIGMYDLVNDQFYTNSGTGTFTKGQDASYVEHELKNAYIGEYGRRPGANTLAYYPLTSTTTVNDMSGNGKNLTNGGALFGVYSGVDCVYINGSSYLTVPDIVNNTSEWTMLFYIKPSSTTGTIFSKQWDGNNTSLIGMGFYTNSGGQKTSGPNYYVYGKTYNAGGSAVSSDEALSTSSWNNVVLVGNSSSLKVYVNGVLKNTGSGNYSFPNWNSYTTERIGSRWADGNEKGKLTGYMGSFIFENKNWSTDEISAYYNLTKSNYGL